MGALTDFNFYRLLNLTLTSAHYTAYAIFFVSNVKLFT